MKKTLIICICVPLLLVAVFVFLFPAMGIHSKEDKSFEKMLRIYTDALNHYANDHDKQYPKNLELLSDYGLTEKSIKNFQSYNKVEYPVEAKSQEDNSKILIRVHVDGLGIIIARGGIDTAIEWQEKFKE